MPRFGAGAFREFDDEVYRLVRSDPIGSRKRRPQTGARLYGGIAVPGYTPTTFCKGVGVVRSIIPDSTTGHSFFICEHNGTRYLFNTNDFGHPRYEVPLDGSHVSKYKQYQRPMMNRASQIELSFNEREGECNEFSMNLSKFWHHPTHKDVDFQTKDRLFVHMVSCCVGARNTSEWHDQLWNFE